MKESPPAASKSRWPVAAPLLAAALLGAGGGAVEVALRASSRLGLSPTELILWCAAASGLGALALVAVTALALVVRRWPYGAAPGALLLLQLGMAWRFDVVVNALMHEARVWGPLLAIAALSALVAAVSDGPLRRRPRLVPALGLVGLLGLPVTLLRARPESASVADDRPSVLLITLDTTRADRIGAYGATNATPNIDALAGQGTRFAQVISTAPLTEPSHLAMLTGVAPYQTGIVTNGTEIGDQPMMISRVLQAKGYDTAAFVSGFPLHSRYGWAQGFDVYDDDFGAWPGLHRLSLVRAWDQVVLRAHVLRERAGGLAVARAERWLKERDGPYFLWVHLFDAHSPYEAPSPYSDALPRPTDGAALNLPPWWPPRDRAITDVQWLIAAYEAEIRYTDALVGELVAAVPRPEHTVVTVTADHGESLTEHGLLFEHGDNLHDPSLLVPWILRGPGVERRLSVHCQVSNLDLTPTLLGLLHIDDGRTRLGLNRVPELAGEPCREEAVVATTVGLRYVADPPVDHALRTSAVKLIRLAPRPGEHGAAGEARMSLYDLAADPGELDPLLDGPESSLTGAPALLGPATTLAEALAGAAGPQSAEGDAQTVEALRALGYVR